MEQAELIGPTRALARVFAWDTVKQVFTFRRSQGKTRPGRPQVREFWFLYLPFHWYASCCCRPMCVSTRYANCRAISSNDFGWL